jgi:hypothetical protein
MDDEVFPNSIWRICIQIYNRFADDVEGEFNTIDEPIEEMDVEEMAPLERPGIGEDGLLDEPIEDTNVSWAKDFDKFLPNRIIE